MYGRVCLFVSILIFAASARAALPGFGCTLLPVIGDEVKAETLDREEGLFQAALSHLTDVEIKSTIDQYFLTQNRGNTVEKMISEWDFPPEPTVLFERIHFDYHEQHQVYRDLAGTHCYGAFNLKKLFVGKPLTQERSGFFSQYLTAIEKCLFIKELRRRFLTAFDQDDRIF